MLVGANFLPPMIRPCFIGPGICAVPTQSGPSNVVAAGLAPPAMKKSEKQDRSNGVK